MSTRLRMAALVCALVAWSASAQAAPVVEGGQVKGRVVQVTATDVYVDFGATHGVRKGDRVQVSVGRQEIEVSVLDVWKSGARCSLASDQPIPRIGADAGAGARAPTPPPRSGWRKRRLARPKPLPTLLAKWNGISLERPRLVTYGQSQGIASDAEPESGIRGLVALEYMGQIDPRADRLEKQYHQIALRSDLDVPSLLGGRLDYSHRLRLRYDLAPDLDMRPFAQSRSLVRIYRLRAGFHLGGVHGAVGRTQVGAVPQAGLIDGASVRTKLAHGLSVGAWAGAAPRITDLAPAGGALGFGAYGSYRHQLDNRERTRIAVDGGFLGTTYDGALDRRALSLRGSLTEADRWLHGQLVLDFLAPTRPSVEPSLMYLDAGMRLADRVRATLRFDQVRSLRTAEAFASGLLPPGYLSTVAFTSMRAGARVEVAPGIDVHARAGVRLRAEGASSLTSNATVRARGVFWTDDHASFGLDGALGTYIDGMAVRLGYSLPVHRRLELSTGYRFYGYRYGGENQRLFIHQPSLSLDGRMPLGLHGHLDIDGYLGDEQLVVAVFSSLARRF